MLGEPGSRLSLRGLIFSEFPSAGLAKVSLEFPVFRHTWKRLGGIAQNRCYLIWTGAGDLENRLEESRESKGMRVELGLTITCAVGAH